MQRKSYRQKAVRYSLISFNALLLIGATFLVFENTSSGQPGNSAVALSSVQEQSDDEETINPLDQLSSADIAVNLARVADMPQKTAVTNQADSMNAELAVASASEADVVAKPQVISTIFKSRKDIKTYKVVQGDTVSSIATKFGVTSDSVRWSNAISGETVRVGDVLQVPPVSGIVYTVVNGDTPDSLATKFKASKEKIIAYNDAEIAGLKAGEKILIPDGQQPAPVVVARVSSYYAAGFSFGSGAIYGYNGYDYGYCTWYVANRVSVPSNWGNANTWDDLAGRSGWVVSTVPRAGAIAQTDRGSLGHVAVVDAVSEDGTQIKYSDMNGLAGWGREGRSDWVPVSKFETYIYR